MRYIFFLNICSYLLSCSPSPTEKAVPIEATVSCEGFNTKTQFDVKRVVQGWNRKLGFNYFRLVPSGGDITIKTSGRMEDFDNNEYAVGVFKGYLGNGLIYIRSNLPTGKIVRAVLYHELGHALNLEHSSDVNSIMFPLVTQGTIPNRDDIRLAKQQLLRLDMGSPYQ